MYDHESSKLLIDEDPLQVLPGFAAVVGLNMAEEFEDRTLNI